MKKWGDTTAVRFGIAHSVLPTHAWHKVGVKLGFAVVEKLKSCLFSCFPFLFTVMLDQVGGLLPVLVTWVTYTVTKV